MPRRVHAFEVAVEPGDAQHVERQREEPVELLLRAPPIDEHADLVADRRQHRQQVSVGLADFAAEELHDAEHFAAEQHRKAEGGVQSFARGDGRAREVRVVDDVGNPDGFAAGPDAAGKADAALERRWRG